VALVGRRGRGSRCRRADRAWLGRHRAGELVAALGGAAPGALGGCAGLVSQGHDGAERSGPVKAPGGCCLPNGDRRSSATARSSRMSARRSPASTDMARGGVVGQGGAAIGMTITSAKGDGRVVMGIILWRTLRAAVMGIVVSAAEAIIQRPRANQGEGGKEGRDAYDHAAGGDPCRRLLASPFCAEARPSSPKSCTRFLRILAPASPARELQDANRQRCTFSLSGVAAQPEGVGRERAQ
jgi:hypothetical protein